MSSSEHRAAALANQRAAAFIRFQMLGDHEAMHFLLTELDEHASLGFVTPGMRVEYAVDRATSRFALESVGANEISSSTEIGSAQTA